MDDQFLSPKQAASALQVSESSLRRWCDQGLLEIVRTAGGHRKIPIREIVQFARSKGLSLSPAEVSLQVSATRDTPPETWASLFADALLSTDSLAARRFLMELFNSGMEVSEICDNVIAAAFHIIGDRWSCDSIDVYQERRSCEIVTKIMHEIRGFQQSPLPNRMAIGGTLSHDYYSIPTAMVDLVLSAERYRTENLGTSLPASSFVRAVHDLQPQILWISVSHIQDESQFIPGLQEIWSACVQCNVALILGGRALTEPLIRQRLTYTAHCDSMRSLKSLVASIFRMTSQKSAAE
ncbi:B12-binding domain-containing protein [Schlesneria sp. T3-172]|uniref:B12-binding domain-containing protein n=1 Tax=Schlesneria sphaerica TaxID=3373610 RepID=UPI0037C789FD